MSLRIGLVLAGGAAKGAYQIGVWRGLAEFGIAEQVRVVAGTSVGALNAALFMQGDLPLAEAVWTKLTTEQVFTVEREQLLVAEALLPDFYYVLRKLLKKGLFSRRGLEQIMDRHLRADQVSGSLVSGYATCLPLERHPQAEYLSLNQIAPDRLRRILLASSAIPGIFSAVDIDGVEYTDGGIGPGQDNLPVRPVYDQGCNLIFVVSLDHEQWVEEDDFPNAQIVSILPSQPLGGLTAATDFSPATASRRMELGYRDTCAVFAPVKEMVALQAGYVARLEAFLQAHRTATAHAAGERARREMLKAQLRRPLSDR